MANAACASIKDQLLSQGTNHFAIFTSAGRILGCSGDFVNNEKCRLAYVIVQQCAALMRPDEKLKRVTMAFGPVVYVATTMAIGEEQLGVIVKRAASFA